MVQSIAMYMLFVFEAITILQYLNTVFVFNGNRKRQLLLFIVGYVFLFAISQYNILALNLLMFSIVNAGIAYFCYESHIKSALFHGILLSSFMFISEIMVYMVANELYGTHASLENRADIFLLNGALAKLVFFIICKFVSKAESVKWNKEAAKERGFLLLAVLPLATLVILFNVYNMSIYTYMEYFYNLQAAIGSVLLLFANVVVFSVYETSMRTNQENMLLKLAQQKQQLDHEHYTMIRSQYNESRMLIHDIRNHFSIVEMLIQNRDFEKVQRYIASVSRNYNLYSKVPITSNKMLDVICYQEMERCKLRGIVFEVHNERVNFNFVDDVDLCTVLTNLLDNAIEACEKCMQEKKITLSFYCHNEALQVISIINSCAVPPKVENHRFLTTKGEKENHGYGLMSVERALEKYNGQADFYYDDETQTFHSNIIFSTFDKI